MCAAVLARDGPSTHSTYQLTESVRRRPDRLRTAHLPGITVPCLFISGTRDAFGAPSELEAATALIRAPVTHVWLDGKDHALRGCDDRVAEEVTSWLVGLVRS